MNRLTGVAGSNKRRPGSCRSRRGSLAFVLSGVLFLGASTRAFAFDDATRSAALQRYEAGRGYYEQGQYEAAARQFQLALERVPLPLLALWTARCYELAGHHFAAQSFYRAALRLTPNELWLGDKQQRAQSDASKELEQLTQRIEHGPSKTPSAPPTSRAQSRSIRAGVRLDTPQPKRTPAESRSWNTVGWVSLSAGGAALAVGTVTGIMLANLHHQMEPNCSHGICDPDAVARGQVDEHNNLHTASSIGFVAGGILTAAGLTLVLATPSREPGPRLSLQLTPVWPLLRGAF